MKSEPECFVVGGAVKNTLWYLLFPGYVGACMRVRENSMGEVHLRSNPVSISSSNHEDKGSTSLLLLRRLMFNWDTPDQGGGHCVLCGLHTVEGAGR